ncbi:MAG: hypothetical protein SWY16_20605 [Cyanobacteriota bacterium]|nr:hypothetical protein [Cyanobacteriota bacterium]
MTWGRSRGEAGEGEENGGDGEGEEDGGEKCKIHVFFLVSKAPEAPEAPEAPVSHLALSSP